MSGSSTTFHNYWVSYDTQKKMGSGISLLYYRMPGLCGGYFLPESFLAQGRLGNAYLREGKKPLPVEAQYL